MATPAQQALFQQWAVNTNFIVDLNATPKAEFTRLAVQHLNWVGGGADWKSHWFQCFGEPYPYNPHPLRLQTPAVYPPSDIAATLQPATQAPQSTAITTVPIPALPTRASERQIRARVYEARLENIIGTDLTKLDLWHELCKATGINPLPPSINKCKEALYGVYVNLFDLIDHLEDPNPNKGHLIPFNTKAELRAYSEQEDKIYPKKAAKKKGIVKKLLRHLFSHGH